MKKLLILSVFAAAASALALPEGSFSDQATRWIAGHKCADVANFSALVAKTVEPCAPATTLDTTVTPALKAKKVRVWGTHLLETLKSWGLDVAEFDADAVAQGDIPDVVFMTQGPGYYQNDVEVMYRAAAEGVHFVSLCGTDQWSGAIARRLGFSYDGVLTIGSAETCGATFVKCPKLFAGFPEGTRLDAFFAPITNKRWMHGMYLTGDRCLMGVVDVNQGRVATAVAQYAIGRGAFTLFGPRLYETPNEPVCKRLLLNLINLREKPTKPLNLPCVYHPTPREGKPYFELNVPGEKFEYLTQARPVDHIWHLGFFFSWKFINGENFWEPRKGRTRVVAHQETGDGQGNAVLTSELAYELDGRVLLRENRTVKVTKAANGNYAFDWTADFTACEKLDFTSSKPKWDKEKGTSNGNGYCGLSARLARNDAFTFAYKNTLGSLDARCYGDVADAIDVTAKSKKTGATTRLLFKADKPTANYVLHLPQTFAPNGFHFVAFPECFNTTLTMAKGEKRSFHYTVSVEK